MTRQIWICFALLFANCQYFSAQPRFQRFNIANGLSNNSARVMYQDQQGYLWIGTLNGLNRFDGYKFKEYHYRPNDTTSIRNNRITNITQDSRGMFYLTTFDGGIHQFDNQTEIFKAVKPLSALKDKSFNVLFYTQTSPDVFWFLSSNHGCARLVSSPQYANGFKLEHWYKGNVLRGDTVSFVSKLMNGNIAIGTSQGLVIVDNDTVSTNDANKKNVKEYATGQHITAMYETTDHIWIGTSANGVFGIDKRNGQIVKPNLPIANGTRINAITSDVNNHLVIGTESNGLVWCDIKTGETKVFNVGNSTLNTNKVTQIYRDKKGLFWLVTDQRGVTNFNGTTLRLGYHGLKAAERASLAENDQQLFFEDSNGDLWVGLYGGGICKYNRTMDNFEQITHSANDPYSISGDYVLAIYEDRSHNLWIGHYNGGISKLSLKTTPFAHVMVTPATEQTIQNEVRCLLQDRAGNIWAGTKGGYAYRYNSTPIEGIAQPAQTLHGFNKAVYCLFEDKDGNLWIGTKGNGIFVVRANDRTKDNPPFVHFKQSTTTEFTSNGNNVYDIKQDTYGQYWIATYSGGMYLLTDPFGNPKWRSFPCEPGNPHSLSDDRVRQLLFDTDNNLWVATSSGLNVLPLKYLKTQDKQFTRIVNLPGVNENISNNDVTYMAVHSKGQLYFGTFGGGLNILKESDVEKGIFKWQHVMKSNGLSSNVINSILTDNDGILWLATDNGLNRFDPTTESVEVFYEHDGLGANAFSESACLRTSTGELLFGHSRGLAVFNPQKIIKDKTHHNLCITRVEVNNLDVAPGASNNLRHDYRHNNFTFEFATLDLKSPEKHVYSFILEDFDQEWSKPSSSNQVSYRGLPPGSYTFKVKGTNSDGIWTDQVTSYSFEIKPPFWNSPIGYAIMTLIIVGLVIAFYYLKLIQVKLQHELKYNDQLNEQKIRYYTNISHEFKTPLTLIMNPTLEILENRQATDAIKQKAGEIQRNARYLLHLIEQILDFRRIREDRANLQVGELDMVAFFREMHLVFVPLAQKKGIDLAFASNTPQHFGYADSSYLEKIGYNLLSNAIKHTPAKKRIELLLDIDTANNRMTLKVTDEGKGIEPDELSRIFERFYKSHDSSGIGLFFTRELVMQHGGEIKAESTLGQGSVFTVTLPIGKDNYAKEQMGDGKQLHGYDFKQPSEIEMAYNLGDDTVNLSTRKPSANKESILVIEDNPSLLSFLTEKLGERFNVSAAMNGKEGLKTAREKNFDLILCDYMMPEMDGLETLKQLKSDMLTSAVPVIVLTAISNDEKVTEAFGLGADDYITKPFNINNLIVRIDNLITQRKRLKQTFANEPEFSKDDLPTNNNDKEFLEQVTKIVDENIANIDFSVDYIADKIGMSRTVFYKKMKLVSGYSPNEFIQLIRMKKAAFLIKNSNLPIVDIAIKVGFNDANYFSKCFKSHFGVPPSVYQKQG